jgi:hypothetical protein
MEEFDLFAAKPRPLGRGGCQLPVSNPNPLGFGSGSDLRSLALHFSPEKQSKAY